MKTILELRDAGLISQRLYTTLLRAIARDNKFYVRSKYRWDRINDSANANELTVKDILELWTEEEIRHWYGMGPKALEELKGLV